MVYIAHHGILGQRWGKKNGPPYPLDAEDHSASEKKAGYIAHHGINGQRWGVRRFQNLDGSLTTAGRERYGVSTKQIDSDFEESKSTHKEVYDRVISTGKKIVDEADVLGDEYSKAFKKMTVTPQMKKDLEMWLHYDFGDGADDEEYFEMCKEDHIGDMIKVMAKESLGGKREQFDKLQEKYWDDVHAITNDLIKKYNDVNLNDSAYYRDGKAYINHLMGSKLETSLPAYISRHFDDYWVNDTDDYYDAVKRLTSEFKMTMSDYNKKYGK